MERNDSAYGKHKGCIIILYTLAIILINIAICLGIGYMFLHKISIGLSFTIPATVFCCLLSCGGLIFWCYSHIIDTYIIQFVPRNTELASMLHDHEPPAEDTSTSTGADDEDSEEELPVNEEISHQTTLRYLYISGFFFCIPWFVGSVLYNTDGNQEYQWRNRRAAFYLMMTCVIGICCLIAVECYYYLQIWKMSDIVMARFSLYSHSNHTLCFT